MTPTLSFLLIVIVVALPLRAVVNWRAAASLRDRRHWVTLQRTRALTGVSEAELAALLGVTTAQLSDWEASGVPVRHHADVVTLFRKTRALRREVVPPMTTALLRLQLRRSIQVAERDCSRPDLTRDANAHHIEFTVRP